MEDKEILVAVPMDKLLNRIELRDFFAGMALAGTITRGTSGAINHEDVIQQTVVAAYIYADEMLKARLTPNREHEKE